MDDVPVKIIERYKPPPLVYQLPQTIANRLAQYSSASSSSYYDQDQAYQYDFQLERSVLSKCQQWRRMRHQQHQARQGRQEQRKQARQRALEAKQKEMLGAVEYPNAADLSSDSDDDDDADADEVAVESPETTKTTAAIGPETTTATSINAAESRGKLEPKSINSGNFHNILQPTILSGAAATPVVSNHKRNSSLNYADFEYNMNSTPFDNIELKTINDLDILAQVLHQTQLTQQTPQADDEVERKEEEVEKEQEQEQSQPEQQQQLELTVTTLAETKATLDSVNFHVHCDDAQDIPAMYPTHIYNNMPQQQQQPQQQQHIYPHMVYNQQYYPQQQQLYHNHNYLQYGYVNGYGTPTQLLPSPPPPHSSNNSLLHTNVQEGDTKSRSVPDILRELKTELQQAEKRRARLHSHNENEQQTLALTLPQQESETQTGANSNPFLELDVPAQKLAQRISSMGFPLERVVKVVTLCGIDDKKIIEHLIPLGELIDLGFDETKISAALMKFDNNKDRALDYLIK
ncbi:probable basic-leucine zipper transcription factor I isoform X2 [Drosophila grimshawi]|uniref:GH15178 n=1 Tax=Drosophila grimshawi TaxID=7222 RepID=B4JUR7_DROGR|nr:probable basic-leucine zipper transcription factor I isoform X2 [Drosophila grimshawi]EDV91237.1 GH15178 [Drosophila grimshawi]